MSCASLNQQTNLLSVTLGSLPEGFCPSSWQEGGQAIVQRLIITPTTSSSSFAIGPIAPTSNVGPWLKDCLRWFVWDDTLATYVPIPIGYTNEEFRTASGTFTVPNDIYRLRLTAWGAGGGGATTGAQAGGGGGGGAFSRYNVAVIPGQAIPLIIGTGGASGAPGIDGGATTVLTLSSAGGKGAVSTTGGLGGVATGGTMNFNGQAGQSGISTAAGFGGLSPQGGGGGVMNFASVPSAINGGFPGGGGTGGTGSNIPGNGAGGAILIEY